MPSSRRPTVHVVRPAAAARVRVPTRCRRHRSAPQRRRSSATATRAARSRPSAAGSARGPATLSLFAGVCDPSCRFAQVEARRPPAPRAVTEGWDNAAMAPDPIDVDRLRRPAPVEAVLLDGFRVGEGPVRDPHRHGYHELILVRAGRGEQLVDGEPVPVRPGTVTVIGQGQVHQFLWAEELVGGLVRFTDEALQGRAERVPRRLAAQRPRRPGDRAPTG